MSKADFKGSNLVKSYRLQRDGDEPMIIDTNSIIEEKLERIRMIMPVINERETLDYDNQTDEFVGGLDAKMLDALTGDSFETEYDEDGNPVSNIIKAEPQEDDSFVPYEPPAPVYEGPSPEELIAEANEQIEQMKKAAMQEIEREKDAGYEDGRRQGYAEGKANAEAEISAAWQELENARAGLAAEREQMVAELEPQFIHAITSIYEKVFEIDLRDEKQLVINLLRGAMLHIESTKNYLIHVSRDDHQFVLENKDSLITSSMSPDVTIDIIEDVTMRTGDCMIETSGGIFDCSLGTELEALKKKLELLSYTV